MKSKKKESGNIGFSKEYWDVNYSEPEEMDNIINAKEHADYLKALFALEMIDVNSIIDLGFGKAILFKEMLNTFNPYRAVGIEPSEFIYQEVSKKKELLMPSPSTKLQLINCDIVSWCKNQKYEKIFDLGICTSVFQYLTDEEISFSAKILAERIKYIYFSVPTDKELKIQIEEVKFFDQYAIHRSKSRYLQLLKPHFTFVSSRILESKYHYDKEDCHFSDLLFRF